MSAPNVPPDMPIRVSASHTEADVTGRLQGLAEHLGERLSPPFPFSGEIAFEAGDGPVVHASHFQEAVPPGCPFNVLSVGKLFTAVAVMQLIEEKKFTLDTPLSKLLNTEELDLPLKPPYEEQKPLDFEPLRANSDKITVAHLLSHTAGFVHRPAANGVPEGESWVSDQAIGKYAYSNYGFQLLARIIGKHSSQGNPKDHENGFRKHITERIFARADMAGAIEELRYPYHGPEPKRFAVSKEGALSEDHSVEPYPHGNGCWRMRMNDLFQFGKALRRNTLITKQSFQAMVERDPPLAFMVDRDKKTNKVIGYGHPGGAPGQSSFIHTWLTDPPITAAVLSNYSNGSNVKPLLDPVIPPLAAKSHQ